jgi:hypothetical protein
MNLGVLVLRKKVIGGEIDYPVPSRESGRLVASGHLDVGSLTGSFYWPCARMRKQADRKWSIKKETSKRKSVNGLVLCMAVKGKVVIA